MDLTLHLVTLLLIIKTGLVTCCSMVSTCFLGGTAFLLRMYMGDLALIGKEAAAPKEAPAGPAPLPSVFSYSLSSRCLLSYCLSSFLPFSHFPFSCHPLSYHPSSYCHPNPCGAHCRPSNQRCCPGHCLRQHRSDLHRLNKYEAKWWDRKIQGLDELPSIVGYRCLRSFPRWTTELTLIWLPLMETTPWSTAVNA